MRRELVISAGPGEWRAALVEDGTPVELRVERGDGAEFGSLHLGRVRRLLPALGAALVDIGGERPAFLPQSEIFPRGRHLAEGERVMVQIRREPQGGKAARLSTAISLRGRNLELLAGRPGIIGAEALAAEDQTRLASAVAAIPHHPPTLSSPACGGGLRRARVSHPSRTGGEGRGEGPTSEPVIGLRILEPAAIKTLIGEATVLRHRWDEIAALAARLAPPARLHPAATLAAALRGALPPVVQILVDDPAAVPQIRAAFPDAAVAHLPEAQLPFDLDPLVEEALSPTLALPGGGFVHFEPTHAAQLIDVDSGAWDAGSPERTALAVNLAAAELIARQIRLRNLAGGIVVDFVGLDDRGARERVRAALAGALAADPMQPQILGWTRLGHLEAARRRRTRPVAETLLETASGGGFVKTAATLAYEALRALRRAARAQPGRAWRLAVGPDIAAALSGEAAGAVRALEDRFGRAIAITADAGLTRDRFQITPL